MQIAPAGAFRKPHFRNEREPPGFLLLLKIAQHFSAGVPGKRETSPAGTAERFFRPCGTGTVFPPLPSTKVLGYFQKTQNRV